MVAHELVGVEMVKVDPYTSIEVQNALRHVADMARNHVVHCGPSGLQDAVRNLDERLSKYRRADVIEEIRDVLARESLGGAPSMYNLLARALRELEDG